MTQVLARTALPAALALAIVATWAPSLGASFQFDDWAVIVDNPRVQSLAAWWSSMPGMRALTKASWALDHELGGGVSTFRLTSLAIHVLNALLVWRLLRVVGSAGAAAVAAIVFALHPVQTESVSYLAARSGQLAATGALLALLAWREQFTSGRPGLWAAASLLGLAVGLAGKETAAVTPLAMALLAAVAPEGPRMAQARALIAPVLLVLAALAAGLWWLPYGELLRVSLAVRAPLDNLLAQVGALGELASHLVLWQRLNADPGPHAARVADAGLAAGFALIAALLLAGLALLRRRPAVAFGILWTFIWLAPTNSLLARLDLHNDRQWYLAIVGPGWLLGLAIARLRPAAGRIAVLALALALAAGTVARNRVYETEIGFWRDVLAKSPRNARAANNLGIAHARACELPAAAEAFERAIALAPREPVPAVNRELLRRGELPALPPGCRPPQAAPAVQSSFAPESRTTLAHVAMSAFSSAANASGAIRKASAPAFATFSATSGVRSASATSALIWRTAAAGVPAGANSPNQGVTSKPAMPDSAIVGMSRKAGERFGLVTASGRIVPLAMKPATEGRLVKTTSI